MCSCDDFSGAEFDEGGKDWYQRGFRENEASDDSQSDIPAEEGLPRYQI